MHQKLKEIIEQKHKEVAILKREGLSQPDINIPPLRDFKKAISTPNMINLISEIKFASPSAGIIRKDGNPAEIGLAYKKAGASAISFLTDKVFFNGDIKNLSVVKDTVTLPILRKDFIIDEIQVREALIYGADAILLIARILTESKLRDLITLCSEHRLAALTEVHDINDLDLALKCGADIIGINNRDLDTFHVDINTTMELVKHVPKECILVSESGIESGDDIRKLKGKGVNAVLVGSALMSSGDPGKKVIELVEAGKGDNQEIGIRK
ncbi:MAG: indole-3-glycerol phosphate synthase TrpC [Deltaproteobacteria bacterium]|nr:indole-3-glycerol phosphate synthase TrpC [Deltaproteobacteria bacterium]